MPTDRVSASGITRIGVLTGGGDCPGLNAVIRAVTKDALFHGMEVFGIEDGFLGLIEDRIRPLTNDDVSNILGVGGTILGSSNKANPQKFAVGKNPDGTPIWRDMTDVCMTHLEIHGIQALVVIGGDGTMSAAKPFADRGINCIGVPKTIDNDLWGTDITFGFQTAVAVATDALDRVHTTAASHHRVMVVEVMGRNAGWIALHAGVASGSDVILIPEIPFDLDVVCDYCLWRNQRGKRFSIICASEGAKPKGGKQIVERYDPTSPDPIRLGGIGKWLANEVEQRTEIESRYVVLGHVQRGGTPVPGDRILATLLGDHAMRMLHTGKRNRLVVMQGGILGDVEITAAADKQRLVPPDDPLIEAARSVYTCFGDS
ncbi:MAG: 6-phosphofructokinase [Phycisphaeraceae bacterium]|nr:6-phosphofructokinase [Phycisphaeraceae bacterium]MCW5761625.1 6-phosphofructokinase [Phycisphaeraceae bacterium]